MIMLQQVRIKLLVSAGARDIVFQDAGSRRHVVAGVDLGMFCYLHDVFLGISDLSHLSQGTAVMLSEMIQMMAIRC